MLQKACDLCHLRKAKCSGNQPCERCARLKERCTYLSSPKKKGPKRRRRSTSLLISELGESPDNTDNNRSFGSSSEDQAVATEETPTDRLEDARLLLCSDSVQNLPIFGSVLPREVLRSHHEQAGFLNIIEPILISEVTRYLSTIYPLVPIVDPTKIRDRMADKEHFSDRQLASLLLTMCANSLIVQATSEADMSRADDIMRKAVSMHAACSFESLPPSLEIIATCMLIGGYMRARGRDVTAYIKTREAISHAELMGLDRLSQYDTLLPCERELAMRILWKLAVADRSNSLIQHRAMAFRTQATPLALAIRSPLSSLSVRLQPITRLFDIVDAELADCMNGMCAYQGCKLNQTSAISIYGQVQAAVDFSELSPVQAVDATITRLWLLSRLWQGCLSHSLLEAVTANPILQILFPLTLLRQSAEAIDSHPFSAFAGNGRCISVKLGEIGDAAELVTSVMVQLPTERALYKHMLEGLRRTSARLSGRMWIRCESP